MSEMEALIGHDAQHFAPSMITGLGVNKASQNPYFPTVRYGVFSFRYKVIKRAFDLACSSLLMLVFMPIGTLIAILICLTSRGPVFYREYRVGRMGIPFKIWKFRTMYTQQEQKQRAGVALTTEMCDNLRMFQKHQSDPRVTPLGRILRKWSPDELPQLINVFLGDMSIVGPRPIVEKECPLYQDALNSYLMARPGITGLWQVSGRSDVSYRERVSLDREYVTNWSFQLDTAILLKTLPAVLSKRGAY
jgi:exopolysaccharide production protein ExoY